MIEATGVNKRFGDLTAVKNLHMKVPRGTFYGLLGPNGAGKTTTIRMLSMLLTPDEGEIFINSKRVSRRARDIKKLIGVVPQHLSLQKDMSVKETLTLHGYMHRMGGREIKKRIDELLAFAAMEDMVNRTTEKLSGGNKRKLMILRSVMHNPEILFLDEPTVALDPAMRRTMWDLLKKLKTNGLTIILTTHYIEEAHMLCDTIAMMNRGEILKEASPKEYMQEIPPVVLEHFNGRETLYHYFDNRQEAADAGALFEGDVRIRKSTLEDVYMGYSQGRSLS